MLKTIGRDRRIWLLILLGVLTVLVTRWAFPTEQLFDWLVHGGYWVTLAVVTIFGWSLKPLLSHWWKNQRPGIFELFVVMGIVACVGVWSSHEKKGFKILADEVLLLGTSMGMHLERQAAYPVRMTDVQGPIQILQSVLDKRPLLFPFLTSLVHDLTGYRASNPFYLNTALAALFLWLIYCLGSRVTGEKWGGVAGIALFAGLPLLAQQSAGGGFELLNLVLLVTVILLIDSYLKNPDTDRLQALVFASLLLAFTRYESVLFILPVAVAIVWGWARAGRLLLSWPVMIAPLFMAPVLIQNRIFTGQSAAWELAGVPGATTPFGLHYVPGNLGHALAFFFDFAGYQPSSPLFALLGLLALPFFGLWLFRVLRERVRQSPSAVSWSLAGLGLLMLSGTMMIYFWGQFDHPVIHRLSLPTHLLFALSILVIGTSLFTTSRGWKVLAGLLVAGFVLQGIPVMSKQAYEKEYTPGVEMAWRSEFIKQHPSRDYLFIDKDSVFWITQKIVATPIEQARKRKEGIAYHLRNHSFSGVYVFQRFQVDDQTGALKIDPTDDIGEDFEIEPVWEKRITTLLLGRIGRVTSIRENGKTVARAGYAAPSSGPALSLDELEKVRAKYLENWIKQLP